MAGRAVTMPTRTARAELSSRGSSRSRGSGKKQHIQPELASTAAAAALAAKRERRKSQQKRSAARAEKARLAAERDAEKKRLAKAAKQQPSPASPSTALPPKHETATAVARSASLPTIPRAKSSHRPSRRRNIPGRRARTPGLDKADLHKHFVDGSAARVLQLKQAYDTVVSDATLGAKLARSLKRSPLVQPPPTLQAWKSVHSLPAPGMDSTPSMLGPRPVSQRGMPLPAPSPLDGFGGSSMFDLGDGSAPAHVASVADLSWTLAGLNQRMTGIELASGARPVLTGALPGDPPQAGPETGDGSDDAEPSGSKEGGQEGGAAPAAAVAGTASGDVAQEVAGDGKAADSDAGEGSKQQSNGEGGTQPSAAKVKEARGDKAKAWYSSPLLAYADYNDGTDQPFPPRATFRRLEADGSLSNTVPLIGDRARSSVGDDRDSPVRGLPSSLLGMIPQVGRDVFVRNKRLATADEEEMDRVVTQYKRVARRGPMVTKISAWYRGIRQRSRFLRWKSRRRMFKSMIFSVWAISWRAGRITRMSSLRKSFLMWKEEYMDTRHTREMSQKLFAGSLVSGKLSTIVLNLFFNDKVTSKHKGMSRKAKLALRKKHMKGYMSAKARARAEAKVRCGCRHHHMVLWHSSLTLALGPPLPQAKKRAEKEDRLRGMGLLGPDGKPVVRSKYGIHAGQNLPAAGAGVGAGAGRGEVHLQHELLDELGAMAEESSDSDEVSEDEEGEVDMFEQMRQTVEVRVKRAVLGDWVMFIRRIKHHQMKAALCLQRCARLGELAGGGEQMWVGERVMLVFEIWKRYTKFRQSLALGNGIPVFPKRLRQWNVFVDLYQARKMRERKAMNMAPHNIYRRWLRRWKMLKGYKERRRQRNEMTIRYYKMMLLRRHFQVLRKQTRMRGKMMRRLRRVWDAWAYWAEHASKRRRMFYAVKLRRQRKLMKKTMMLWQERKAYHTIVHAAAVERLQESRNRVTAFMVVYTWRKESLRYTFLNCWRRWTHNVERCVHTPACMRMGCLPI